MSLLRKDYFTSMLQMKLFSEQKIAVSTMLEHLVINCTIGSTHSQGKLIFSSKDIFSSQQDNFYIMDALQRVIQLWEDEFIFAKSFTDVLK